MTDDIKPINISMHDTDTEKTKKISINNNNNGNHINRFGRTTKLLEELLKEREIQKVRMEKLNNQNSSNEEQKNNSEEQINININNDYDTKNNKTTLPKSSSSSKSSDPYDSYIPNIQYDPYKTKKNKYTKTYTHINIWDAYWPLIGSGDTDPGLAIELNYLTFNCMLAKKWNVILQTPHVTFFPLKELFKFCLDTGPSIFDFNLKIENIPNSDSPTIIDINPKSTTYPLLLNQFILIKDINIKVPDPGTSPTNIMAVIGYYNTNNLYFNQFNSTTDNFDTVKNLFFSTQFFFVHINQIKDEVKLIISHDTMTGENLFKISIETHSNIEIKETIIPLIIDPISSGDISQMVILQRTIYVNGKYFMTYATFKDDISVARQIGIAPDYVTDARQAPLQLATMLLFGAVVPIIDLNSVIGNTDQEKLFIRLYKEILLKNP